MLFKVTELDKIVTEVSKEWGEKRSKDWSLEHSEKKKKEPAK